MVLSFLADCFAALQSSRIIPALTHTPFDELLIIRPKEDRYDYRYHADGKFFAPVSNNSFKALTDYVAANLIHPDDLEAYTAFVDFSDLDSRLSRGTPAGVLTKEFRFMALNGEWRVMENLVISGKAYGLEEGVVYYYLYDVQDILSREQGHLSPQSVPSQHLLSRMPDQMTESLFFSRVQERLSHPAHGRWCMIAVDIKHFKLFKELNGQEKGEQLLIRFGEILHSAAQECGGLFCYRGQDDYALLYPFDKYRIDRLFSELRQAIDRLSGVSGFFPIFGIAPIEDETTSGALDLFNEAALTAEEIKDDLQFHIRVYDPKTHQRHVEEFRLLSDFNDALKNGEITFYLQPQCRVSTGKIVGAESLARWRKPDGSFISPAFFIPVLEKYGIVSELDRFIWDSVCAWLRQLIDEGIEPVPISVNVSRIDMFSLDVADLLAGLLEKYRVSAALLKVEITESAYVDDSGRIRDTIAALRAKGFQVLMDDFGSGYSSLNMLRSTDMDVIKLDAQFLHFTAGEEQKGINILEAVINMTKSISTPIIVEGVDTQELVQYLTDMGCRYMQGFYFYRPMPCDRFEKLLRNPAKTDHGGIRQPIHEQMHIREFVDGSITSDAMLNNILGPVVFYRLKDGSVDITRFNQQFFRMVGLEPEELEERRRHIENFIHEGDRESFFRTLKNAKENKLSGDYGFFRVYQPGGAVFWMELRVYYLREEDGASLFYGACRDMTELLYVNTDLPGGYCRCSADDGFSLLYISQGFLGMFGYTENEIRVEFGNRLLGMIHPDDRERVKQEAHELQNGRRSGLSPYRVLRRDGSYCYVADQSRFTERFGEPCFQCVLVDITEVMTLRDHMRMLEKYSKDCILIMRDILDPSAAEAVVYGLEDFLGMDCETFLGSLARREIAITDSAGDSLAERLSLCRADPPRLNGMYAMTFPNGRTVHMHIRFSMIPGDGPETACILSLTPSTV